jgi:hypothetical protein
VRHSPEQIRRGAITLARRGFEVLAVDDGDAAVAVFDQARLLQRSRDDADGWTARAELHPNSSVAHDNERFLDGLATLFDLALRRGDATCVIGTADVREGLGRRLRAAGWDVGGPSGHKRYAVIDAADALGRIMRNGVPDDQLVRDIVSELDQYRRTVSEGRLPRLTLFGNMAPSLIAHCNLAPAIALERQWNRLTDGLPFFTVCGYPASCFHDSVLDGWSKACAEHWAVSLTSDL